MRKFLENLDRYLKFYFLISIVVAIAAIVFLTNRVYKVEKYLAKLPVVTSESGEAQLVTQNIDVCGEECQKTINETVSAAVATLSGTAKISTSTVSQTPATAVPARQTTYIPLGGPITTTSMDWVDVTGTDVYIDLVNDYGKNTWVSWEAFLKIADGNGQTFARLYDVTHKIAVNGSEVSVTKGDSTQVISGELKFWAGRNLYRVQIKSLNSFVATFVSGRIKINY